MPDPRPGARVFGVAPGVDFPRAVMQGLRDRLAGAPPEALARTQVIVNSARMQRRLRQLFDAGPPGFLPSIRLIANLDGLAPGLALPPSVPPVRRRLELIALVSGLLEAAPDLAPRTSLYDLADSLAVLMDEMQGEGVTPDRLAQLDVSDMSGHWQRAQRFIAITRDYLARMGGLPDKETRQRQVVAALAGHWAAHPPDHPVIIAGSTGSRGTTLQLMEAVARLPQGALVLPGFDFDQPGAVWDTLRDPLVSEDHPQFRFARLFDRIGAAPGDIRSWAETPAPAPARNRLVSLSLRPAPVTDAWIDEGSGLTDLDAATADITLLNAPTPRLEALTIALRLRAAAETGQVAALITPDRSLTRQVSAALDQWDILPDDSAGTPLHLSPPGRFLRHTADLLRRRLDAEHLLSLLKHPLCHAGHGRNDHVLRTQRLEQRIRAAGLPYPDPEGLERMMDHASLPDDTRAEGVAWVRWVADHLCDAGFSGAQPLRVWVDHHRRLAESLSAGPDAAGSGVLWDQKAGQAALAVMKTLTENAAYGSPMTGADYADLLGALLAEGEVRDRDAPHPRIMIWGTLEARVQGADLVILAGLNEGIWPEAPAPDPWLNRRLRCDAGLLLPERRIGLSAHDYQQAIAAPEVWLSRSVRSDDAETVVSRWLNRLLNLLGGVPEQGGPDCIAAMTGRGDTWLARARAFEAVSRVPPAPRPSPAPPVETRPRHLSVTEIQTLIRDPYAIYARHVLRLRRIGPLVQSADALLRGTLAHDILERFVAAYMADPDALAPDQFRAIAEDRLVRDVPWPAARSLLRARFDRLADWFVDAEAGRLSHGTPIALEDDAKGTLHWRDHGLSLTARADRIDATGEGSVILYDYKSGKPPSKSEQKSFNKQLLIEAAMLEEGAFPKIGPRPVLRAEYIGLKSPGDVVAAPLNEEPPAQVLARLEQLLMGYLEPDMGYTARRAMQMDHFGNDYDLLSRFGEWDGTAEAKKEPLA